MKNILSKQKQIFLVVLIINFAIITLCFANYIFTTHYSADSFSVMLDLKSAMTNSLRNGRLTSGGMYYLMDKTGLNITLYPVLSQLLCAGSLALFVTVLLFDFIKVFDKNEYNLVGISCIFNIGFLFLVLNPNSMCINFFYVENSALYAVSNLILLLPIHIWCNKELNWKRVAVSFFLLIIALDRYQVFIELYIGICLCYSLLKYHLKIIGLFLKEYFVLVFWGGIACVINILQMRLMQRVFEFEAVSRAPSFSVDLIVENIKIVVRNQWNVWYSTFGLLPNGYLLLLILAMGIGIIGGKIQKKEKETIVQIILLSGVLLTIWIFTFAPLFLTGQMWMTPRTYWGMYSIILFFICILIEKVKGLKYLERIYIGVLGCFLIVMMIRLGEIQVNTIISNNLEQSEMESIVDAIYEYEEESGKPIEKICYQYDRDIFYKYYDRIKYSAFEYNSRISGNEWGFEYMLQFYLGRDIEICKMDEKEYKKYFDNEQWDKFNIDEQICFDEGRVYIAVY